jgi:hypothetical protein
MRSCFYRIVRPEKIVEVPVERLRERVFAAQSGSWPDRKAMQLYMDGIQVLVKRRPWLTWQDAELFLQGWFHAPGFVLHSSGIPPGTEYERDSQSLRSGLREQLGQRPDMIGQLGASMAGVTRMVEWTRQKLYQAVHSAMAIGDSAMSNLDPALHGLNLMSIDEPKKTVEGVRSWQEARDYPQRRIKDLKFSMKAFEKMINDGVPWPSSQPDATRNYDSTFHCISGNQLTFSKPLKGRRSFVSPRSSLARLVCLPLAARFSGLPLALAGSR